ncbi:MAG: ASCH domain-containing protein [Rhodospirillaceae bacterium]|nr:ASCH domain-containing protein [Rhodospirillaceae bacterium]
MSGAPKPTPASPAAIAAFLARARNVLPAEHIGETARYRCIGMNADTANLILNVIAAGDKVGTFSPVWLHEKKPETRPYIADLVALCDFAGVPKILVTTTRLDLVTWRDIGLEHTAIDGPSVRALEVWRPMHWKLWTAQLAEVGVTSDEDMPICVERFRVLHKEV